MSETRKVILGALEDFQDRKNRVLFCDDLFVHNVAIEFDASQSGVRERLDILQGQNRHGVARPGQDSKAWKYAFSPEIENGRQAFQAFAIDIYPLSTRIIDAFRNRDPADATSVSIERKPSCRISWIGQLLDFL